MEEKIKPFDLNDGDLNLSFSNGDVEISIWDSELDIPPLNDKEFLDLKRFVDEVCREKYKMPRIKAVWGGSGDAPGSEMTFNPTDRS